MGADRGLPADGVIVGSHAEAHRSSRRPAGGATPRRCSDRGRPVPHARWSGDEGRLTIGVATSPVDIGAVMVDGRLHWFVAHLVARRSWWTGRIFAAMNAQFIGSWDVAARSHRTTAGSTRSTLRWPRHRWRAGTRVLDGSHVPHPGIAEAIRRRCRSSRSACGVWLDVSSRHACASPLDPRRTRRPHLRRLTPRSD